jgi:hypothetical protein
VYTLVSAHQQAVAREKTQKQQHEMNQERQKQVAEDRNAFRHRSG